MPEKDFLKPLYPHDTKITPVEEGSLIPEFEEALKKAEKESQDGEHFPHDKEPKENDFDRD